MIQKKYFIQKNAGSSGGQRQTISLLLLTLTNPKILLLDDPTAALDKKSATTLLSNTIKYVKKNNIITLLVTHDTEIIKYIGNKIILMENGKIKEMYTKKNNKAPQITIPTACYKKLEKLYTI